jgi:hypothetical protein
VDVKNFSILTHKSPHPTVVTLEGVDGGTQHAVTLVDGLIFDANCARALTMSQENLDYCCSTDDTQGKFKQVYFGYTFMEHPNTKKPRLSKLTKQFNNE